MTFILIGVICGVVGLKGFMMPNHFIDGGVTGISILAYEATGMNISFFLIFFNIPFIYIGYQKMGETFAVQTIIAIFLLAILMNLLPIPTVTNEKLLIAIFGGVLMGLCIGFVIRGGGVIDGFEVIAHYTQEKIAFSSSEIVLVANSLLFLILGMTFGLDAAMYSILTYFTASKTSDYVVDGFEEYTALTVISKEHEQMKSIIVNDFGKAISVYKGERGYLPQSFDIKNDCDIIMTIVTRLEIHYLKEALIQADPHAFFYIQRIKEVKGGVGKQSKKH